MKAKSIHEYKAQQQRLEHARQRMTDLRKRVLGFMATQLAFCEGLLTGQDYGHTFQVQVAGHRLSAFEALPGGVLVADDRGNRLLFYYDILTGKVVCE